MKQSNKTCPFCGSQLEREGFYYYCDFCYMKGITPAEDGQRKAKYKSKFSIDHEDVNKTTPELMLYHTFDLLRLLKFLRDERRSYYHNIQTFRKAGLETDEFKAMEDQAGEEYERLTRKTWIVENLLKDRIGYIPAKVTDKLLATVEERMTDEKNVKPMKIIKSAQKKATYN